MKEIPVTTEPLDRLNKVDIMGMEFLESFLYTGINTYKLTIPPGRFEFSLIMPDGREVSDSFVDLHSREGLYGQIEDGRVYDWLKDVENRIQRLDESENIHLLKIPVEHYCYHVKVDLLKKECWIQYPQLSRFFHINELYSMFEEIPFIEDGQVEMAIIEWLEEQAP